jgi:hypothetical protein
MGGGVIVVATSSGDDCALGCFFSVYLFVYLLQQKQHAEKLKKCVFVTTR